MNPIEFVNLTTDLETIIAEIQTEGARHACAVKLLESVLLRLKISDLFHKRS